MGIDADNLAAIGRVASTWSELEFSIDRLIWELAEVEQMYGACITSQLGSIHARFRSLKALTRLRGIGGPTFKKLNRLSDKAQALLQKRNRIVHDPWAVGSKDGLVYRLQISIDSGLEFGFTPAPLEEVHQVHQKITNLIHEFLDLKDAILAELSSLPQRHPEQLVEVVPFRSTDESQNPET